VNGRGTEPPGAYRCRMSNRGPYIEKMPIEIDSLLTLPDGAVETLLAEFKKFWTLRENFSQRGFTFKRGLLMWGPPGSGKTSAIWQMTQELVRLHRGVVLFVEDPQLATICIGLLRRIEPDRPMITIMEDLDALVSQHGDHGFLALLDGETQISNVVHVATTNYPEYLDKRFVDRPSRFDTIMRVGMPSAQARRVYFKAKEPSLDDVTLERWVKRTDDYSIAHLREVIIATKCFDQDEDAVFGRLDGMRQQKIESDGNGGQRGGVGFLRGAR
jgi:AAA+ superfamily predicted ATPase